ncbi:hypothetical protein DENSPDRAFT_855282, partial [Dentipellis sp. KUC8613]
DPAHKLTTTARPKEVKHWIQRHCIYEKPRIIEDLEEYGDGMRTWIMGAMPDWRRTTIGWPLSRVRLPDQSWAKAMRGGPNSFAIIIVAISWWIVQSAEAGNERAQNEAASVVEDLVWSFTEMNWVLRAVA